MQRLEALGLCDRGANSPPPSRPMVTSPTSAPPPCTASPTSSSPTSRRGGGDTDTVTVASSQFCNYRQCNSLSGRLRDGLLGLSLLKHVSKHIEGTLCNKEEVGEGCGEFTGDVALSQQQQQHGQTSLTPGRPPISGLHHLELHHLGPPSRTPPSSTPPSSTPP